MFELQTSVAVFYTLKLYRLFSQFFFLCQTVWESLYFSGRCLSPMAHTLGNKRKKHSFVKRKPKNCLISSFQINQ